MTPVQKMARLRELLLNSAKIIIRRMPQTLAFFSMEVVIQTQTYLHTDKTLQPQWQ